MARVDGVLARLSSLYPRAIDLSLDRMRALMARLGNPQDRLPPVIHVAGTNGKGSTIATMRACLEAAGYRVHVYTSPHLVAFTERVRLAGRLIGEEAIVDYIEQVERLNAGDPITVFEVTTAAAFLAFAAVSADILLLEVGLGGRLDATNLIAYPELAAITPISMDHMSYLGDRLAQIAGEKAGILKAGCPAIIGRQVSEAAGVIEAQARAIDAPLYRHGHEWFVTAKPDSWRYQGNRWQLDLPRPSLPGDHQIDNAGLAIACLEQLLDFEISPEAIAQGLQHIEWPARLQLLTSGSLAGMLPEGWELWLDGGHNAGAGEALAAVAAAWGDRPLHLVIGMLNNRDPNDFVRPMERYLTDIVAVGIPGEANGYTAVEMAKRLNEGGYHSVVSDTLAEAVHVLTTTGSARPSRILISGSLYLAGHVLAENG